MGTRKWIKCIPPKKAQQMFSIYKGLWMPHMDRYWESDDGYSAMSRQIKTDWGVVEHLTITRMGIPSNDGSKDILWAVKQEIKDELIGDRYVAIEVFPDKKSLVDICDVYHLWVLPKGFRLPFGIHPLRDPEGVPVERGFDFDLQTCVDWTESEERKAIYGENESQT